MTLLILGVLVWTLAHYFKRLAPGMRASMGNAGKGVVALGSLAGIVLMVIGYGRAEFVPLWDLGPAARGINNLLMVFAVILIGLGNSKSRLRGKIRHPMLSGVLVWVVAHLLVNGDLASVVLFGGLGLWALGAMALINRAEPRPEPWQGGSLQGDIRLIVISAVVYAVIAAIHMWIGPSPFTGV